MRYLTQRLAVAALRCLRRNEGVAAVEFAIIAPVLVVILAMIADLGLGFRYQMQVGHAARAGLQYALNNGWNSASVIAAVTSATGLTGISASPAPFTSCGCATGSGISAAACGSNCPTGGTAGTYVTVNASYAYTPILPYPSLSSPMTLTAQAVARIQ